MRNCLIRCRKVAEELRLGVFERKFPGQINGSDVQTVERMVLHGNDELRIQFQMCLCAVHECIMQVIEEDPIRKSLCGSQG